MNLPIPVITASACSEPLVLTLKLVVRWDDIFLFIPEPH